MTDVCLADVGDLGDECSSDSEFGGVAAEAGTAVHANDSGVRISSSSAGSAASADAAADPAVLSNGVVDALSQQRQCGSAPEGNGGVWHLR